MNTKLVDAVREIAHKRTIGSMDDFTGDEIMGLTALYMDGLSVSEQLEMVVEPNPQALLKNLKSALRGEGEGAYGLMDPRNLMSYEIMAGVVRWSFVEIEDALEQVITEESHSKGVY